MDLKLLFYNCIQYLVEEILVEVTSQSLEINTIGVNHLSPDRDQINTQSYP
jgi:hypothetical protein